MNKNREKKNTKININKMNKKTKKETSDNEEQEQNCRNNKKTTNIWNETERN